MGRTAHGDWSSRCREHWDDPRTRHRMGSRDVVQHGVNWMALLGRVSEACSMRESHGEKRKGAGQGRCVHPGASRSGSRGAVSCVLHDVS